MSLLGLRTISVISRCLSARRQCCLVQSIGIHKFVTGCGFRATIDTPCHQSIQYTTDCLGSAVKHPASIITCLQRQPLLTVSSSSRWFHTSAPRNIPPVLLIIIKPVAKVASVITGRWFRKWWKTLPEEHRAVYRQRVLERRPLLLLLGASLVFAGAVHYYTHISETPVTHRRRYLAFTQKQFAQLADFEYTTQLENVKDKIVQPTHPVYQRVVGVVRKIVNSNQDLEFMRQQTWTVLVVESNEANAFVLPSGHIFVYTGLLKVAENDNQLAVVLGHEMAHALLSHAAEQVSFATVLDVLIIIMMAAVWALMPTDGVAVITQWFYNKVIQIMLHLPYNRKLEEEADQVGLELMAKACYDVRESSAFWNKMTLHAQLSEDDKNNFEFPEWLSTHPNNENRAHKLDVIIPSAIELRTSCQCPVLPDHDPRVTVDNLRRLAADHKKTLVEPPAATASVVTLLRGGTAASA